MMAIGFLGYVLPFGQMSLFYSDKFNSLKISFQHSTAFRYGARTFIYCYFLKFYFKLLPLLFKYYTPTAQADINLENVL
jgi:hypothetical protein